MLKKNSILPVEKFCNNLRKTSTTKNFVKFQMSKLEKPTFPRSATTFTLNNRMNSNKERS